MLIKNFILLSGLYLFILNFTTQTKAQTISGKCLYKAPNKEWADWFEGEVAEFKKKQNLSKNHSTNYVIPVIFHIIHNGEAIGTYPNISQAKINSQIPILNNDFAGTGFNASMLAQTGFSTVGAANCNITFCLAQKDSNGTILAEPGIDRINRVARGWTDVYTFGTDDTGFLSYLDGTIKPASIWNPHRYLNIWVANTDTTLMGVATPPVGTNLAGLSGTVVGLGSGTTDGVFCNSYCIGDVPPLKAGTSKGRTVTHEIGHYLGLYHIFGDALCGTDYCNDTPVQFTHIGCPNYPNNSGICSNPGPYGEMFMNFMDYTDDNCKYMFTPDQSTRMQTAMQVGTYRNMLTASAATLCNLAPVAPVASFILKNTGCKDSVIKIQNQTSGIPVPSYSWVASPPAGVTFSPANNVANPDIIFSNTGNYTISLLANNASGNSSKNSSIVISNCDITGLNEAFVFRNAFKVEPNPSSGVIKIRSTLNQNIYFDVLVTDCLGRTVLSEKRMNEKNNAYELNLSNNDPGIYFITISNAIDKVVKRLIIEK